MSAEPSARTNRWIETSVVGLVLLGVAQAIVGGALTFAYDARRGHESVSAMLARGGLAEFLPAFHLWGSHTLLAGGILLLAAMFVTGACAARSRGRWWSALAFVGASFGLQVTGNLLPQDRHAVQTTVIEASIAGRVPLVGPKLAERILAGPGFGEPTVALWYAVHRFALPALFAVAMVGLVGGRRRSRQPILASATILPIAVAVLMALAVGAPIGEPASAADANGYDALPGWYVWPMHGAMKAFDAVAPGFGWVGTLVLPGLAAALLLTAPFWANRLTRKARWVILLVPTMGLALLGPHFGGRPASLIADEMASEEVPLRLAAQPVNPVLVARGEALFRQSGCTRCHGIDGSKGAGGPDLTFVHRKHPSAEWYRHFVRNPRSVRPNSTMPAFALSDEDVKAIAEFLRRPRT